MSDLEKSTIELWLALNLAQIAVKKRAEALLKNAGLPPLVWFEVLYELEFSDGGLQPYQLQKLLFTKQANLSRLLRSMVEDGVIFESPVAHDGRGKIMQPTHKGRALSRRMWQVYKHELHSARAQITKIVDPELVTQALRGLVDATDLDHYKVE